METPQGSRGSNPTTISGQLAKPLKKPVRAKVNIATPSYGSTYAGVYVQSLYKLLTNPNLKGIDFSLSNIDYADIVVARNYLISNFYFNKPECTHILFWDDDMGFDPGLIELMLASGHDVVGTMYPKRTIDFARLHWHNGEPFPAAFANACDFIGDFAALSARNQPLAEMRQCGTGILLISRQCLDLMVKKIPEIIDNKRFKKMGFTASFKSFITPFSKIELEDRELSEDFSFCYRWVEQCGGKIFACTAHAIEHVGQLTVKARWADRTEK